MKRLTVYQRPGHVCKRAIQIVIQRTLFPSASYVCGAWTQKVTLCQNHRPREHSTTANEIHSLQLASHMPERGICGVSCGNPFPALNLREGHVRSCFILALQTLAENTEDWLQLLLLLLIHKGI
eukprot:15345-Heterococcus_DN1.PRE.2